VKNLQDCTLKEDVPFRGGRSATSGLNPAGRSAFPPITFAKRNIWLLGVDPGPVPAANETWPVLSIEMSLYAD
jgi:hypothetical protein